MSRLNVNTSVYTHEGAKASKISAEQQLRRSVMACMLWEDTFYEEGVAIEKRIAEALSKVSGSVAAQIAIDAREKFKLRHVPLWLVREMARGTIDHKQLVASTLARVIQRPDELTEYVSMYWKDKKQPLSAQSKKGLAQAFTKFNEYQLAKYNRKDPVKLRDVLFLCHAKPKDKEQEALWQRLIDGEMKVPETWETLLSSGADKKRTWEGLLYDGKLGALALLRNLRNMKDVGVDDQWIIDGLDKMKTERVLPFRFLTAAKYAPSFEPQLERAMFKCLEGYDKLKGRTILLVDGSGSMFGPKVSAKSELDRFDAAVALAMMVREVCENPSVVLFSGTAKEVPARRGFGLKEVLYKQAERGGTNTQHALRYIQANFKPDRIILITDEQSHQKIEQPSGYKGYVVNVANYQNGIGYGAWTHIDGWSEAVLDYIITSEQVD